MGAIPHVTIEAEAVGRDAGTIDLKLNIDNPTVSTASDDFVRAADGARGWEGQAWTRSVAVPMTTLDTLVARHGVPAFIKIDVEGFEAEALAGLTRRGRGVVVRVHLDPTRRCARLRRTMRGARLCPLRRRSRREPEPHA